MKSQNNHEPPARDEAVPDIATLAELFYLVVDRGSARVLQYRDGCRKQWIPVSAAEFYRNTAGVSRKLGEWGIGKGDCVAIISENRAEWAVADFAAVLLGAATVPIYPTLTPPQTAFILKESGARVLFVSTESLLNKCLSVLSLTSVEKILSMDTTGPGNPTIFAMDEIMQGGPAGRDSDFDTRARDTVRPGDLATIIYTSGTTGSPKGVMLSHANLCINCVTAAKVTGWPREAPSISYLPLSHVTARHVDYCCFLLGITLAYCGGFDQLPRALQDIRPRAFVSVPRVYEKVRADIRTRFSSAVVKKVLDWSQRTGKSHRAEIVTGKTPRTLAWRVAHALVFRQVSAALGGRVQVLNSGGAPLGEELANWYANCGLPIYEGYGLTETSPVVALNVPGGLKVGSVGRPLANVECRIAADGELLVRGPSIFKEYWRRPRETAEAFELGWFKTGDIGRIDPDGFLFITDRKKDLIKTSGGKFVAPQPIELALKAHALVSHAVVVGEGRRFFSVLIVPDFTVLEQWGRENGIAFSSREELTTDTAVCRLYDGIVAEVNQGLAGFESLKKVLLIAHDFTAAAGELTPSMKVRRREVEHIYKAQIDALYQ